MSAHANTLIVFGGHSGLRHLNDRWTFDLQTKTWSTSAPSSSDPMPRDSHTSFVHKDHLYIIGGSNTDGRFDMI